MPRNPPKPGSTTRRRMLQAAAVTGAGIALPAVATPESDNQSTAWPGSGPLVLSGRLTDDGERPLAGRTVGLLTPGGLAGECRTDGDGRFVLAARAARRGTLVVDARAIRAQPVGGHDAEGVWRGSVGLSLA